LVIKNIFGDFCSVLYSWCQMSLSYFKSTSVPTQQLKYFFSCDLLMSAFKRQVLGTTEGMPALGTDFTASYLKKISKIGTLLQCCSNYLKKKKFIIPNSVYKSMKIYQPKCYLYFKNCYKCLPILKPNSIYIIRRFTEVCGRNFGLPGNHEFEFVSATSELN